MYIIKTISKGTSYNNPTEIHPWDLGRTIVHVWLL